MNFQHIIDPERIRYTIELFNKHNFSEYTSSKPKYIQLLANLIAHYSSIYPAYLHMDKLSNNLDYYKDEYRPHFKRMSVYKLICCTNNNGYVINDTYYFMLFKFLLGNDYEYLINICFIKDDCYKFIQDTRIATLSTILVDIDNNIFSCKSGKSLSYYRYIIKSLDIKNQYPPTDIDNYIILSNNAEPSYSFKLFTESFFFLNNI